MYIYIYISKPVKTEAGPPCEGRSSSGTNRSPREGPGAGLH